jgi:phosphoribosylamine--glycine ligase
MKVLVIGSGGREHALAWRFAQDGCEVVCAPGNPGTAKVAVNTALAALDAAAEHRPDLIVVGPEDPLIAGLADELRAAGFAVAGPGAAGARLEASKAWSKELMAAAGIPTAQGASFTDFASAQDFARQRVEACGGVAVKASGAALGKGVVVCGSLAEAEDALEMMLVRGELGDAGRSVVVEDRLVGPEFSLITLVGGGGFFSLPIAQDHKAAFDFGQGPNTGGMGAVSPAPGLPEGIAERAEAETVAPLLKELEKRGVDYRGVLFSGFMIHNGRPLCLEFNVRFGDPETQCIMPRLEPGLAESLLDCAEGRPPRPMGVNSFASATVVLASGGYPGAYQKGLEISLPDEPAKTALFFAGVEKAEGGLVTSGGRVLGATAWDESAEAARLRAYDLAQRVKFAGRQMRSDIGLGG